MKQNESLNKEHSFISGLTYFCLLLRSRGKMAIGKACCRKMYGMAVLEYIPQQVPDSIVAAGFDNLYSSP